MNVNFRYVEEELRYLFDNSDLVALVYQREYGPLVIAAARRAAEAAALRPHRVGRLRRRRLRRSSPIEFEAAIAAGSPERDFGERSDDDIYLLYTGGTTGMPKGVMWRQEDVYFALGGGIDAFTQRAGRPTPDAASDKIDAVAAAGLGDACRSRRSCTAPASSTIVPRRSSRATPR